MFILTGLLIAAQATTPATETKKSAADRLICVQAQETGTRLGGHRICRTKSEWEQDRRDARNDTENAQRMNYNKAL